LFGCHNSEGNKEENMELIKNTEAINVIDSTAKKNNKDGKDMQDIVNEFTNEINVEIYVKKDKDIYGNEIKGVYNLEINALYLTNEDFPEIVVSCSYNKNSAIDYTKTHFRDEERYMQSINSKMLLKASAVL